MEHAGLHWVTANDGNGNHFPALTRHPNADGEEHVGCWVYIDGPNGWNANVGDISYQMLKKAGDGTFVA